MVFAGSSDEDTSLIKVRKKRKKRPKKFEIWFTEDQDVHMRQQTLNFSLKMLMSYFYESRCFIWRRSWDIWYDERR